MAAGEEIWLLLSRALALTLTTDSLLSFRGEWVGRVPLLSLLAAAAAAAARTAATACAESMLPAPAPIVAGEAAAAAAAVAALECC